MAVLLFQQVFGISYAHALLTAVYAGALIGAFMWTFNVDPIAWLMAKKNPRV